MYQSSSSSIVFPDLSIRCANLLTKLPGVIGMDTVKPTSNNNEKSDSIFELS